jgi:hypothetical protein
MKFTRLSHQILFFFVTITIFTLSLSGWATTTLAQRIIVNNITWQHQVLAHRIAQEIELRREDIRPILSNLADTDNVRSMNSTDVAAELQRYQTYLCGRSNRPTDRPHRRSAFGERGHHPWLSDSARGTRVDL